MIIQKLLFNSPESLEWASVNPTYSKPSRWACKIAYYPKEFLRALDQGYASGIGNLGYMVNKTNKFVIPYLNTVLAIPTELKAAGQIFANIGEASHVLSIISTANDVFNGNLAKDYAQGKYSVTSSLCYVGATIGTALLFG